MKANRTLMSAVDTGCAVIITHTDRKGHRSREKHATGSTVLERIVENWTINRITLESKHTIGQRSFNKFVDERRPQNLKSSSPAEVRLKSCRRERQTDREAPEQAEKRGETDLRDLGQLESVLPACEHLAPARAVDSIRDALGDSHPRQRAVKCDMT